MRRRLGFLPRPRDTAPSVELESDLGALDAQRTAAEPPLPNRSGEAIGSLERGRDLGLGLAPLGLCVGQPCTAADDRAIEARLAVRRQLHGDAQPILVRSQAAAIVGQL